MGKSCTRGRCSTFCLEAGDPFTTIAQEVVVKTTIHMVLLIAVLSTSASARSFLGVGPRGGYYKSQDAEEGEWLFGGGVRLKLGTLGFEGSIDYRSEQYASGALTVRSWPVMASVLLYPLPIVYGVAGMGWYNTTMDYDQSKFGPLNGLLVPEDKTDQEVGWHFGGGVELPLGRTTTLAADIRYVFIDYDFGDLPGSDEYRTDFYAVTISLLWGLGR